MPAEKYHVTLTVEEHRTLEQMLRRRKHSTRGDGGHEVGSRE